MVTRPSSAAKAAAGSAVTHRQNTITAANILCMVFIMIFVLPDKCLTNIHTTENSRCISCSYTFSNICGLFLIYTCLTKIQYVCGEMYHNIKKLPLCVSTQSGSFVFFITSPYKGYQPIFHLILILAITFQSLCKYLFLIDYAEHYRPGIQQHHTQ